MGRCALPGLEAAGHQVVDLGSSVRALLDGDALARAMDGCDALVNLSAQIPVGFAAWHGRSWRAHDLLRSEGAQTLVTSARRAGVRLVVHQSVSFVYADAGADWITEESPVCVTTATEPASVGEVAVQKFASASCRTGVVLRMGLVVGNSRLTRWSLRATAHGRAVGVGSPDGYIHVIHSDDVGPAVDAALLAPSGIYNLGAEPVRREVLVNSCAEAVGRDHGSFVGPVRARFAGSRIEPLTRSLRVSSSRFSGSTGWSPQRDRFDTSWFEAAGAAHLAMR